MTAMNTPEQQQPFTPQPRRRLGGKMLALILAGGLMGLCACGGGGLAAMAALQGGSSCYVGFRGEQVSVTLKGRDAEALCRQLITDSPRQRYQLANRPTEPIICSRTVNGTEVTVRDQGVIPLNGHILCDDLAKLTLR